MSFKSLSCLECQVGVLSGIPCGGRKCGVIGTRDSFSLGVFLCKSTTAPEEKFQASFVSAQCDGKKFDASGDNKTNSVESQLCIKRFRQ